MVQKKLPLINAAHGSDTRNIINELIKLFNNMGYTYDEALYKSEKILSEARKTNDMNVDVQKQLNSIILENGNSEAEVVQARGRHDLLNERLKSQDKIVDRHKDAINREIISNRGRKPMITIIDDDGRSDFLTQWLPIIKEKTFKIGIGVITDWVGNSNFMSWDELENLKEKHGVDLLNHTHTHRYLGNLSEEEVRWEFENSTRILKERGHNHDIMVYPYGSENKIVRQVAREYTRVGIHISGGINIPPLETFKLNRVNMVPSEDSMGPVSEYTAHIDDAINNNGWLILMSHSQFGGFDQSKIKSIIDYANSKDIEWVYPHEGLDRIGNLIDSGDYVDRAANTNYTILDADGKWHSYSNHIGRKNEGLYKDDMFNKPITDFERLTLSSGEILGSNTTGLPEEGYSGTLETYRAVNDSFSYQIWKVVSTGKQYRRRWNNSESTWYAFESAGGGGGGNGGMVFEGQYTGDVFNKPATDYPENSLSTGEVLTSSATGFPEDVYSGILQTYRGVNDSFVYQTWKIASNGHEYMRRWNRTSGAWEDFKKRTPYSTHIKTEFITTTIPANGYKTVNVTVPEANVTSAVTANPRGTMPAGVVYSCNKAVGVIQMSFINMTSSDVVLEGAEWKFVVTNESE